jgi:hypothetical protein
LSVGIFQGVYQRPYGLRIPNLAQGASSSPTHVLAAISECFDERRHDMSAPKALQCVNCGSPDLAVLFIVQRLDEPLDIPLGL